MPNKPEACSQLDEALLAQIDAADQAIVEMFSNCKGSLPPRRKYLLEHQNGEWVFVRDAFDLEFEEAGRRGRVLPEDYEERRYGFKLPRD